MSFTVVIPARIGSSRLPGKPLLDIAGKPMVQWVWEKASQSNAAAVVIATDDTGIEETARAFGAQVCMTNTGHPSGTDRLQQVASMLNFAPDSIVVNVQGDEPLIPPVVINQVATTLERFEDAQMATLCEPIAQMEEVVNPNVVKVVRDDKGRALYFSRAPIPWDRRPRPSAGGSTTGLDVSSGHWFRHIGLYAYRTQFLHDFVRWPVAPLEAVEQLEQLRALHHGAVIHVAESAQLVPAGVDTQEDLDQARRMLAGDAAGDRKNA